MNTALLRTPRIAWPTVVLALCTTGAWLALLVGVAQGWLPVVWALPALTVLAYVSFTPMHDASHGAVGGSTKRAWLDQLTGHAMGLWLLAPFEVFRSLSGRRRGRKGAGIGLAIVRRIAETHRGRVWVESEPGRGAAFRVSLPRPSID